MRRDANGSLKDIEEAAGYIVADTVGMTFDAFLRERRTRQAVERNFEIIGEAVNRLHRHAPEIVQRISSYRRVIGLRNALIHGYDEVDYPTVWRAVQEALPVLRAEIEQLLREAEDEENASRP